LLVIEPEPGRTCIRFSLCDCYVLGGDPRPIGAIS
jgi:hypothetical protein